MAFVKFYNSSCKTLLGMKHWIESDSNENDYHRFKLANSLYPEISFIPIKKMMDFKSNRYMDVPLIKSEDSLLLPLLPPPPVLPAIPSNIYYDPENPHCKRKPLPLEKCPICKKYFRRMNTHLQKHAERRMLPSESSLVCKFCSKMFSNLGNLSIHMRTHTGMKPYICSVCSKGFAQSCNLTNHMRIHTGERPFKCPHCDRAFTQSGNLSNHIRLHLDQKPFKCHFCDRAFTQSGNLNSHIKNNHKNEAMFNSI